jgi:hypothetical protein
MKQHFVHGDGQGVVVSHDHHGQGISNQDDVDAGLIHQPRGGIVVGGKGDDGSSLGFLILKCLDGHPAGPGSGRGLVRAAEMREAHGKLQCNSQ